MMRGLAVAVGLAIFVAGCSDDGVPAKLGEPCGAQRGCAEGLTCQSGRCASVGGGEGPASSGDGGASETDAGLAGDAGNAADGGAPGDAGTSDAGTIDGGASACVRCDTPPTECHARSGRCENGRCVYAFVENAPCDDGNPCTVQDTCQAGACSGTPMVCGAPPAAACTTTTTLSTYDPTGVCQEGRCVYTRRTVTCQGACANGACQNNACATTTCDAPPSVCYRAPGTCENGACSYPFDDGMTCSDGNACTTNDRCATGVCVGTPVACVSPPANTCADAYTAKIYDAVGSCAAGTCSYPYRFVTCSSGCSSGVCNGSGWRSMVSNSNEDLLAVWGTSPTSVWAGGTDGTMLYYNGAIWQARSTGIADPVQSIHGTSASNVFAVARHRVLRFDGTEWRERATTTLTSYDTVASVFVLGNDDALVYGGNRYYSAFELWRVTGGTATKVTNVSVGQVLSFHRAGLWAFSPTNVWVTGSTLQRWNGTQMAPVAGSPYGEMIWAGGDQAVFSTQKYQGSPQFYNGSTWRILNTGFDGEILALWGTAANRVFAAGYSAGSKGAVLFWDGTGWTREPIPETTPTLESIWVAPAGDVFAVGSKGTILRGP